MTITSKNRTQLKSYFVKNAIPTEGNFADLVDAQLNQADDGVFKLAGEPLSVVAAAGDQQRVLRLYREYPTANADWLICLKPAQNPADPATTRPGFGITDGAGNVRLFIDPTTGNVGVGTNAPAEKLTVAGDVRIESGRYSRLKVVSDRYWAGIELVAREKGEAGHPHIDFTKGELDAPNYGIRVYAPANNALRIESGDGTANLHIQGNVTITGDTVARKVAVHDGTRTGVGRGLWLWSSGDSNHVIYSLPPNDPNPANRAAVAGHFDAGHRMRFRTSTGQGFLFENHGEKALVDIDSDNGNLWTAGAVYAGNSDIYFNKIDHNHSGIGNTQGYAAIENAANYEALMILGRQTPEGRIVKLWDSLEVNGPMRATGGVRFDGNLSAHIESDGAIYRYQGQCYITVDDNLYIRDLNGAIRMHFDTNNGVLKTDVLRLGDKWRMSGIGDGSANDDWLRLFNVNNNAYYGGFAAGRLWTNTGALSGSDLELKSGVQALPSVLDKLLGLRGVEFRWKGHEASEKPEIGLVAQEVERVFPELVEAGPSGHRGVKYGNFTAVLLEAIKEQQQQIFALQRALDSLQAARS